ncbi:hypothetical protein DXN04_14340 [Chitinophaga silvisoli]|uniref:Uncharacterized protein n=1 Tax=Chitinophaga silvisoli TaxID=2291814 RepID=A0A3E1P2M0_9BACT|nr:hypothetical protein DXN04_14340 [Chitinophaga silvisoli]
MYLHYNVEPHFLREKFEIFHPVGSISESDAYVKQLMKSQEKGKTYSDFYLTDMSKNNVLKPYTSEEISKKQRLIKDNSNDKSMRI